MKNYVYSLVLATAVIFATSCKKEYSCKCSTATTEVSSGSTITTTATATSGKMSKKDAEAWCSESDASYTSGGYQYEVSCELK